MQRVPMTPSGHQKLRDELDDLMKVQRPQNVRDIAEARAHGDLSENAEYHAAKERQSFIEGRIQELQDKIARAEVIDPSKLSQDRVAFGATVTVMDIETEEELTYTIVGSEESDVKMLRISCDSPMARALIGKEVGDECRVRTPGGLREFEIVGVVFE